MLGEAFDVERRMRFRWHDGVRGRETSRAGQLLSAACGGVRPPREAELGHNLTDN